MAQEKPLFESKTNKKVLLQYILFGGVFLLAGELLLYAYFASMEEESPISFLIFGFLFSLIGLLIGLGYFWMSPKVVASQHGFGLQGIGNKGAWRWSEIVSVEPFVLSNWLGSPLPSLVIHLKEGKVLKLWDSSFQNLHEFRQALLHFTSGKTNTFTPISYKTDTIAKTQEKHYDYLWKSSWWKGDNSYLILTLLSATIVSIYGIFSLSMPAFTIMFLAFPILILKIRKSQYIGISKEGLAFWAYSTPLGMAFRKRHIQQALLIKTYKQPLNLHLMTKDLRIRTFSINVLDDNQVKKILQQIQSVGIKASYQNDIMTK